VLPKDVLLNFRIKYFGKCNFKMGEII